MLVVLVAVRSVLVVEGRSRKGEGEASKVEGMFDGMDGLIVAMMRR